MYGSLWNLKEEQHQLTLSRVDWRLNPEHRQQDLKAIRSRLQCHLPSYSSEFQTLDLWPHN